ncbi:UNVERIFIED_CONTAM: cytochrome [Sesamum latifolium]|uniref:Cytochrome n=1 Tax=Sesamum latifolium TaxID=2727402 RepID=A0AAW2XTD6_9LAMI
MSIPLLIALSLIIFVFLRRKSTAGRKLRHPPGPPGLPFFGNVLQYDHSNLHLRLAKLSDKYGPLMSMTLVGKPMIIISSARVAKEALKHNDLAFSSRPSFICTGKITYNNRHRHVTVHRVLERNAENGRPSPLYPQTSELFPPCSRGRSGPHGERDFQTGQRAAAR